MSKLQVKKYVRKPFEIEAIQVTRENFDQVAEWCKGHKQTLNDGTPYIKVKVFKPMGDRQTEAHIGDWVLFFNGGYKVYLDPSFTRSFEEVVSFKTIEEAKLVGISLDTQPIPGNAFNASPTDAALQKFKEQQPKEVAALLGEDDKAISPESSEIKTELLRGDG